MRVRSGFEMNDSGQGHTTAERVDGSRHSLPGDCPVLAYFPHGLESIFNDAGDVPSGLMATHNEHALTILGQLMRNQIRLPDQVSLIS